MKIIKAGYEILPANGRPLDGGEVLRAIEAAGRTCYKSEDKTAPDSAEAFVRNLLRRGHESVLEHVWFSVRFVVDRGVSHEIVRHRLAGYSQESTRYCNYAGDKFGSQITVIDPAGGFTYDPDNEKDRARYAVWKEAMENAEKSYFRMIELGATPQEARAVLPNSLKTEIVITMNLRSWRNFFRLRCDDHAHPQMREVAGIALKVFQEKLPIFFSDFEGGV